MTCEPKKSARSQLRNAEREFREYRFRAPSKFERWQVSADSWLDKFLEHPIAQAFVVLAFYVAAVATAIGFFGIGGAK